MVKPLRRGQCPNCYRPCRRFREPWLMQPGRTQEITQPYCARCGGRGKNRGGIYLMPEEAGLHTRQIGGYLGHMFAGRTRTKR